MFHTNGTYLPFSKMTVIAFVKANDCNNEVWKVTKIMCLDPQLNTFYDMFTNIRSLREYTYINTYTTLKFIKCIFY